MRRADRLFALVQQLRVRRFATADVLAKQLGVSVRTVYRDVRDLTANGVPIQGEAGVGYRLERGFELPPLTFTAEELEALVLGARFVAAQADPALAGAAEAAMTRLTAALPRPLLPLLSSTHLYVPATAAVRRRAGPLAALREAIAARESVRLAYTRADGAHSERVVCPVGLYFWGASWSIAAWCELRGAWRNFRSDRIVQLERTGARFDDAYTLQGYLDDQSERYGGGQLPGAGDTPDPWVPG